MKNIFKQKLNEFNMSVQQWEETFKLIQKKKLNEIDIDWIEIIERNNIKNSKDSLRKSNDGLFGGFMVSQYFDYLKNYSFENSNNKEFKEIDKKIEQEIDEYKSETSINKDGTYSSDKLIIIKENDLKDKIALLKAHGFDNKEWELISARNNIWNVYSKQDGVQELYSSKIVVKPRTEISLEEIEEFYQELVNKYSSPIVKKYENKKGLLFELPIVDLHLGKFSTSDIVSEEYNTNIAKDCFNKVIDTCISRLKNVDLEKIVFPIGQDFFHFDTVGSTTTGGTPQDCDRLHQTLFKDGVMLLIDGINKLSSELKVPVEVFCVQGNHDFMTSYHAIMSLWCYYNNNENIIVDLSTSPRKYVEFGKCLIGYSHGEKEKKRIEKIMQVEASEAWGRTKFREFHIGHLHSEQVIEDGGIIIRNLSSVTGTDAWHHNSGYVGAIRKCTCFLWDKECGIDSTFNVSI